MWCVCVGGRVVVRSTNLEWERLKSSRFSTKTKTQKTDNGRNFGIKFLVFRI